MGGEGVRHDQGPDETHQLVDRKCSRKGSVCCVVWLLDPARVLRMIVNIKVMSSKIYLA